MKRGMSDGCGKVATVFLREISGEVYLLGGMMSDAATETMTLIRLLDDENVNVTDICEAIEHYLDHISWMFFDGGVCLAYLDTQPSWPNGMRLRRTTSWLTSKGS